MLRLRVPAGRSVRGVFSRTGTIVFRARTTSLACDAGFFSSRTLGKSGPPERPASLGHPPSSGRLRILCAGCGAGLQTRDHVAAGYIPTLKRLEELQAQADAALARADATSGVDPATNTFRGHGVVCQRCFQAKHYGRLVPITIPESTFAAYLAGLRAVPSLVLLVCDAFDFHASLLTSLRALLQQPEGAGTGGRTHRSHDVIMVVNKVDLLPKSTSIARLDIWVRTEARRLGVCGVSLRERSA